MAATCLSGLRGKLHVVSRAAGGPRRVCRKKNDDTVPFYEFRGIMDFYFYCLRVIFGFRAGTLWWFLE